MQEFPDVREKFVCLRMARLVIEIDKSLNSLTHYVVSLKNR